MHVNAQNSISVTNYMFPQKAKKGQWIFRLIIQNI